MRQEIIVGFKDIYPDEKMLTPAEYLKDIPRNVAMKVARMFVIQHALSVSEFADKYVSSQNVDLKNRLINHLTTPSQLGQSSAYMVTNLLSSLNLYELSFQLPANSSSTSPLGTKEELNIIKAYLVINQHLIDHLNNISVPNSGNGGNVAPKLLITGMIASNAIRNVNLLEETVVQIWKGIRFFKFLENNYPSLLEAFLKARDLSDWKEYIQRVLALLTPIMMALKEEQGAEIEFKGDVEFEQHKALLDKISHTNIDQDVDFRPLRSAPFFLDDEKRTVQAIVPLFAVDLLFKSLYFQVAAVNNQEKIVKDFKAEIGKKFAEEILLNEVMNDVWGKKFFQRSEEKMHDGALKGKSEGNPDYYVRNGNKVFIFEIKDALLRADALAGYDYNQLMEELKIKLLRNKKGHPKAVAQLALNVKACLHNENKWDSACKGSRAKIYPVLILTDRVFRCPGLNIVLNDWFNDELKTVIPEDERKNVSPLVIVNLDSLILHSVYLNKAKGCMEHPLSDYVRRFNLSSFLSTCKSEEEAVEKYKNECMKPFDKYLTDVNHIDFKRYWDIIREELKGIGIEG